MAFSQQSKNSDQLSEQHEINVTPFIDVMLVLLIIFMVAAPLATVSVPVDLPGVDTEPALEPDQPVYLTLQQDLTLVLGEDQTILLEQLAKQLENNNINIERQLFLRADQAVSYGDFIKVMNALAKSGYQKIALVGLAQENLDAGAELDTLTKKNSQ
ncbi:biopolymer transporter ExbD [Endozoicomonas sp. G2_1]|uniref:biopolymer transporter ExbD n=1 Tax=Endozoicomonas sp. G2_1 TaxID=2821091 RepID=UPI001ADC8E97|nr:biopolymer transporter ExbD [Endozoicomonas sp. G2_1]MBO9489685.1 biopolymer transporter ExbD [Endozoicomonas sp. G2_1]